MDRRSFIGVVSTASLMGVSGCLGIGGGNNSGNNSDSEGTNDTTNDGGSGSSSSSDDGSGSEDSGSDGGESLDLVSSDRASLGESDASIKIFYWNDYQCSFCYRFEDRTLPTLIEDYADTGEVEIIIKPVNVFGNNSHFAALGSHCVLESSSSVDEWYEWHDMMYTRFKEEGDTAGWASASSQAEYADEFDFVEGSELKSCIKDQDYRDRIRVDRDDATSQGFEGTPFFVFYNEDTGESSTLYGAQPVSRFEEEINSIR
jgi:protein-disulfide isomerase